MKIGIEGQRLFRKKKHGMDIVALETIRQLQIIDQSNQYYIFVKPDEDHYCLQETPNFKIVEVPGNNYFTWEQVHLPRYIRKYNLQVLHCTSNTAPLFCPVPLVLTLHDIIFLENIRGKNTASMYQRLGRLYRRWLVPPVVRQARKIITVSESEKRQIQEALGLPDVSLEVIYNGVHERFHPNIDPSQFVHMIQEQRLTQPYFFFLGNTDPKKNLRNVVQAFAAFAEKREGIYLIIADCNENAVKFILSGFGKGHLIHRFRFPGYIHPSQLPLFYKQAQVFLYPSLRESFGLPIIEAMACGTPVITSNTSSMPEIAGDAAILVDPHSIHNLVQAMEKATDPAIQESLVRKGFQRASQFSWKRTAEATLRVYQQFDERS